ncbi:MAG: deoxyribodipyrimidine photo-lyase [Candidatus Sericytochromatia bacterium]|nr:deoxyribodipyrimidine photo-lyase [Candidatus Sericytochromatia bacterium]
MQLVWFKRDLRILDHAPLAEAARQGPCLGLFVFEPSVWRQPTMDRAHFDFVLASLIELRTRLEALGGQLVLRLGEMVEVLEQLQATQPITALYSHQETGDAVTFARDRAVAAWAQRTGIPWHEFRQSGVIRRLPSRDGWAERWESFMRSPVIPAPRELKPPSGFELERTDFLRRLGEAAPIAPDDLGVAGASRPLAQDGGMLAAQALVRSFLQSRGRDYRQRMGQPEPAAEACSRLSPHLAWGTISARQAYHAARARLAELESLPRSEENRAWQASLASFEARLAWRCHFMQKLEDEPAIEHHNMCRAYDGLREGHFDEDAFEAWKAGQTGYPLVDACMRAVAATGWLPFRMRAMVTAFAAYDLWLPWQRPAAHLARMFLDYETGIHYAQIQMQSGTTGINALRMYDVTKQARDCDPDGHFIRRWVPELAELPLEHLHAPWELPPLTRLLVGGGPAYPAPIVDRRAAVQRARAGFAAVRARPETAAAAAAVLERHGSRRSGDSRVFQPGNRPKT